MDSQKFEQGQPYKPENFRPIGKIGVAPKETVAERLARAGHGMEEITSGDINRAIDDPGVFDPVSRRILLIHLNNQLNAKDEL